MKDKIKNYIKNLCKISLVIILNPETIPRFKEEIKRVAEQLGMKVYLRAEGFAFAKNNKVIILGLPHPRLRVLDDKVSVWVRAPYKFNEKLIKSAGLSPDEYYNEIITLANSIRDIFIKYKDKAKIIFIQIPENIP